MARNPAPHSAHPSGSPSPDAPSKAHPAGSTAGARDQQCATCRIDTHAHLWPTAYLDEIVRLGGGNSTDIARNIHAIDSEEDMARRLAMMDRAGVRKQLLSASPQAPQVGTAAEAARLARTINDIYADVVRRYEGRFLAYGAVPLPHVKEAIEEARHAISVLGFRGIALPALIGGDRSVADPEFIPFYEEMNRMGAVIYIHPTDCGANSPMVTDFKLEWVVGAPIEDTLAALQLLKADIPHRCPDIRFHIAHLGGDLAFQMQRIEDNFTDWKAFPRSPWAELRNFWFDTANSHGASLLCVKQTFGHEHMMLGSDFPYFQDDRYQRAVDYIKESDLTKAEIECILDENAVGLLGLDVQTG